MKSCLDNSKVTIGLEAFKNISDVIIVSRFENIKEKVYTLNILIVIVRRNI